MNKPRMPSLKQTEEMERKGRELWAIYKTRTNADSFQLELEEGKWVEVSDNAPASSFIVLAIAFLGGGIEPDGE